MIKHKEHIVSKKDLLAIRTYIEKKWKSSELVTSKNAAKKGKNPFDILYLPFPYIVPNEKKFDVMFYWDSYFTMQGLKLDSNKRDLIKGIVNNCLYEIKIFGMVLNANRKKWSNRSQIPFLTSMIREVYSASSDKVWLKKAFILAKKEYNGYWLNSSHKLGNGLSRYYSQSGDDELHTREYKSRAEASWDMSPRFDDEDIHNLAPVDLNINLYQYEKDFAYFDRILKGTAYKGWLLKAKKRKKIIQALCWNDKDGLYYDYDIKKKTQKRIKSLAGFHALLFSFATKRQAAKMIKSLKYFKVKSGLATCDSDYGFKDRQWSWPYIWAPLVYIVFEGLNNYGYKEEANTVANDFVYLVNKNFKATGSIWEKYNGLTGTPAMVYDRYKNQKGFSWTNAVFEYLVYKLNRRENIK